MLSEVLRERNDLQNKVNQLDSRIVELQKEIMQARIDALNQAKSVCLAIAEVAQITSDGEIARRTTAVAESCAKAIESLKG